MTVVSSKTATDVLASSLYQPQTAKAAISVSEATAAFVGAAAKRMAAEGAASSALPVTVVLHAARAVAAAMPAMMR